MTVSEALHDAARALGAAGVPDPDRDAERLLRHALGWDATALVARARETLDDSALQRFRALVAERSRRVPLQHLVGSVEFWRREFLVSPAALIPRPETELLVETALELLAGRRSPLVVDVGTGTGCIALSIAADRPDAVVHGVDVSADALELARRNARRLGLEASVTLHCGDLLSPVGHLAGRVDLVVSNPPYVDVSEVEGLAPEVREHEPSTALCAPGDRHSVYRRLVPAALPTLAPAGNLILEVGFGMAIEMSALLEHHGFVNQRRLRDLQGIERAVVGTRPLCR